MNLGVNRSQGTFAKSSGYVFSYLLFTFMLSLILTLSDVIKENWQYALVVVGTAALVGLSKLLQRYLE